MNSDCLAVLRARHVRADTRASDDAEGEAVNKLIISSLY